MENSTNYNTANRRIAKNTLVVYSRLFIITVVGLLTARYVLQALGVSDYGLYNVVGGVIAFFAVLSGSLSSTTIRFLNYEMGKPEGEPNKMFNICQITHIVFAVIILLLAETIGIFYILNYLKVDSGKAEDAMFVFQVSTTIACVGIVNVPYQSVFVAKEKFLHIAVIDIVNSLVKLGLVITLLYYKGNALRFYALIMSVTALISFIVYHYLCYRYWPDLVRWKYYKKFSEYKDLLVFNNYNLLASVALLCRSQGSNLLINFFFGTVVNGAYGIARTVQAFVETFTVNFDTASAPQITQNVGKGNLDRASSIASKVCRICQLLSLLIVFPLYVEIEFVLGLWLGMVPEHTVLFCRIVMLTIVVAATGGGFLRLKDALGKIKWFMLTYSFWYFITIPIGFFLFKKDFPPATILVLFIITDVVCRMTQLALMRIIYSFDIITFMKEAYVRPMLVIMLMAGYIMLYNFLPLQTNIEHFLGLLATTVVGAAMIFLIGLFRKERTESLRYIIQLLKR